MADSSSGKGLDGAFLRGSRNLQTSSMRTVVPRCKPGYSDVTSGRAFYWSCAFYCEGGEYYATTGCACACQTPTQEAAWRASGGAVVSPGNASSERIWVTAPPTTTRAPFVPVSHFSTGETGGEIERRIQPPRENYYAPPSDLTTPARPTPSGENKDDPRSHLVALALLFAAIVVCIACIGVVCFNWGTLVKWFKKREQKPKVAIIEPPVFSLQLPQQKCPQPIVDVRRSSLASGRSSTSSHGSRVLLGSSKLSKQSNISATPSVQKDTRGLLKPPQDLQIHSATVSTCSGTLSDTSSVNSQTVWAQPARRESISKGDLRPKGARQSFGKISKVQPIQ
eukprot:Skav204905  [mRNA]  locus=scaffold1926:298088:299101:+ [translate_table: standard]